MIPLSPATHADYLHDESQFAGVASHFAQPASLDELLADIRAAREQDLPITPQGARTALTGSGVPTTPRGLLLSMSRLAGIGPDRRADGVPLLRAGPGATLAEVRAACPPGWFFPADPTEPTASIGGILSTNASGARSYRYGPVRPHVHALTIVPPFHPGLPPEPRVLRRTHPAPRAAVKTAAGYRLDAPDPVDLYIGSEGTLAILAEAVLVLSPVPPVVQALLVPVPDSPDLPLPALRALPHIAAIEYFGADALALLRARGRAAPFGPAAASDALGALAIELHAPDESAADAVLSGILDALSGAGALPCPDAAVLATTPGELRRLADFRHAVPEAVNAVVAANRRRAPALTKIATDFAVPAGRLPELLRAYRADLAAAGIPHAAFGHIGDAHIHLNLLPEEPDQIPVAHGLVHRWAALVAGLGGSLSAEHGIGKLKRPLFLAHTPGPVLDRMAAVKDAHDPRHLLNPGTLLP